MPNFTLEDVTGILRAVCLLPLFVVIPGYVIAWFANLYDFRRRTTAFRLAFSVPLSMALCPIASYLVGRFAGMAAVWAFYGLAALAFAAIQLQDLHTNRRRRCAWNLWTFAAITAAWLAICLAMLADSQNGDHYFEVVGEMVAQVASILDSAARQLRAR